MGFRVSGLGFRVRNPQTAKPSEGLRSAPGAHRVDFWIGGGCLWGVGAWGGLGILGNGLPPFHFFNFWVIEFLRNGLRA